MGIICYILLLYVGVCLCVYVHFKRKYKKNNCSSTTHCNFNIIQIIIMYYVAYRKKITKEKDSQENIQQTDKQKESVQVILFYS